MLFTRFCQRFQKIAPVLVLLQFVALLGCLFYLQYQHQQINDLQNKDGAIVNFPSSWHNKPEARVIPNAKEIQQGQSFEAEILLIFPSSVYNPRITMYGSSLHLDKNGAAHYKITPQKLGKHTLEGYIEWKAGYGEPKKRPFEYEYTVLPKCN